MVNNLENKIFLFLGVNKFTIVAINSANEFVYKEETLTNNQNNQIELALLDNFLNENIFKIEKKLKVDNSIIRHLTVKYKKLDTKNEFFRKEK